MKKKIYDHSYLSLHPDGTCMSPDGKLVFMSCKEENLVYVFNMDNLGVQNKIRTGKVADAVVCLFDSELLYIRRNESTGARRIQKTGIQGLARSGGDR